MVLDSENKYACSDVNKVLNKAQIKVSKAQNRQVLCHIMQIRELEILIEYFVGLKSHQFSSRYEKRLDNIRPRFVDSFQVLEEVNNNLIIVVEGERTAVCLHQGIGYKFRNDTESSQMLNGESQIPDHAILLYNLFRHAIYLIAMLFSWETYIRTCLL